MTSPNSEQEEGRKGEKETTTDWYGTEAPAELNGVNLIASDTCPACDKTAQYEQQPAGYYHCTSCLTIWAGDRKNAELVDYSKKAEKIKPTA